MGLEEAFEEEGFYILAGIGVSAEIIGYILSKRFGWDGFPVWQFILLVLGTIVACAFFATRD